MKYIKKVDEVIVKEFFETYLDLDINLNPVKSATNKAIQSAVSIFTEDGSKPYAGSGVIYQMEDDYTYIITNYHVAHNGNTYKSPLATKIVAYQYGEREVVGKES